MTGPLPPPAGSVLVVIPCLDEALHISGLLRQLLATVDGLSARIVVADGGSRDGSVDLVAAIAREDERVVLLSNPKRIQSAGINLAVERFGANASDLIRIDAHGAYPASYCRTLLAEARARRSDAVVVSLLTAAAGTFQRAVAAAQNSRLGTGGARHRLAPEAAFVDHGHHALVRLDAFRAVGGYDETFTHNEDAEFDMRLRAGGGRIWLTDKVRPTYYPRGTPGALFRQYVNYGRGRARTLRKHRMRPAPRQLAMALVAPACVGAVAAPALLPLGVPAVVLVTAPALAWAGASLVLGAALALAARDVRIALAGPAAMIMHAGWSVGFWRGFLAARAGGRS